MRWKAIALLLACSTFVPAQRERRSGSGNTTIIAVPLKGAVVSAHGKLKELSKKQIVVELEGGAVTIFRRSSKTKFFEKEQRIKDYDISLDSIVTVDAGEDNDLKLVALVVKLDKAAPPKPLTVR